MFGLLDATLPEGVLLTHNVLPCCKGLLCWWHTDQVPLVPQTGALSTFYSLFLRKGDFWVCTQSCFMAGSACRNGEGQARERLQSTAMFVGRLQTLLAVIVPLVYVVVKMRCSSPFFLAILTDSDHTMTNAKLMQVGLLGAGCSRQKHPRCVCVCVCVRERERERERENVCVWVVNVCCVCMHAVWPGTVLERVNLKVIGTSFILES